MYLKPASNGQPFAQVATGSQPCIWVWDRRPPPAHTGKSGKRPAAAPLPRAGENLLVIIFFALFNEGNGLRSKAVGHFVCSQGDSEDVLVVPVVILWTETARAQIIRRVRGWRGPARVTHGIARTDKTEAEPKVLGSLWSLRLCVSSYSLTLLCLSGLGGKESVG